eukprot:TRINITY_DN32826_c0_g1_i1.p1 TRINITY_DN32826_c0_g1~~TRINITY_DN32826_c0_g1_i1.p1  ORF type:complete len:201 (+),score=37.97 TRINITY_DN32826_c0_g1_i1:407-1009(+)
MSAVGNQWVRGGTNKNSEWMYAWCFTFLAPFAGAALVAMQLSRPSLAAASCTKVAIFCSYGFAFFIAAAEFYWFVQEDSDVDSSGKIVTYSQAMFFSTALVVLTVVKVRGQDSSSIWMMELLGVLLWGSAFVLLAAAPSSCLQIGEQRSGCPFPEAFNQNAIMHVIMMASVSVIFAGLQQQDGKSEGFEQLQQDSAALNA